MRKNSETFHIQDVVVQIVVFFLWVKGSKGKTKLDGKEDIIREELKYRVAKSAIARKLGVSRGCIVNFIKSRELEATL